jgi:two-component system, NtrC family, sensor histidine kinase GlrK
LKMRLSIFSRLVIGYTAIFMMIIIVSISITLQFKKLEDFSNSVININKRLSNNKKLMGGLLALVNYEKKFILLKDGKTYNDFLKAKNDFEQSFKELTTVADYQQSKKIIIDINQAYQRYQGLFDKEVESLRAGKPYPYEWYQMEKENATRIIMAGLKELGTYIENTNYEKLMDMQEAGINARKVILVVTVLSVLCGIVLSVFTTRSITRPLSIMRKKTEEIAKGNYEGDLQFSSPREINELMHAFNFMCNKRKEMDTMKSDFFSLMSHELRTPLTSIREGTNLLLEGVGGEINKKQKRLLSIISEESNRLLELINSILDLSKMESGMMTYNFVQANIASLIGKAALEIEPLAKSKNIRGELDISREIPLVKIDTEKMLQVLRNLIGNAVKFTPYGGRIKISTQFNNSNLEVSITDEGPGIPSENLITIFDKFKSFSNSKGTGIGLAIVKNIIKDHGGRVWAESTSGRGSTFTFVLPVRSD